MNLVRTIDFNYQFVFGSLLFESQPAHQPMLITHWSQDHSFSKLCLLSHSFKILCCMGACPAIPCHLIQHPAPSHFDFYCHIFESPPPHPPPNQQGRLCKSTNAKCSIPGIQLVFETLLRLTIVFFPTIFAFFSIPLSNPSNPKP